MERDGTADVAHLHMGTASPKKNPLLVNKGFGSPHGIRPHRMQGDLGEFGTYEMATEKEHSTSYSEMSKAGTLLQDITTS